MSEKKKQGLKEYQKITVRVKSISLIINIFYRFNSACYDSVMPY